MPTIKHYDVPVETDVTIDVDINVDEFLESCDEFEIEEAIDWLKDKEYLKNINIDRHVSVAELEFIEALDKIYTKWNIMSNEETNLIINISKRF